MLVHNTNINTDVQLLQQLKAGNRSGFSGIYQLYAPSLISFAASRLSSLEEARDIIQDIFTHLWEQRETIEIKTSLKSYLFTAVRYRIIDMIRKNITRREYASMIRQLADTVAADTEEVAHIKGIELQLDEAVDLLPARTRQIYRLSRQRHLAAKEIACELGISEQTVKNQLSSALQHLRLSWSKLVSIAIILLAIVR